MPYGNKDLHFGHVGGVFIHADTLARFLRDRLGPENVLFVSGTDCYGSAIVADFERRRDHEGYTGDLDGFVTENFSRQRQTLESYDIEPDLYGASSLEPFRSLQQEFGQVILETLHRHGHLERRTTPQFYDVKHERYLNGRQVTGRCPIAGCRSENAYADECSLGHQYEPRELIAPISVLSGERPEMREVTNWYLPIEPFRDMLFPYLNELIEKNEWRAYSLRILMRFFELPTIHIKPEQIEAEQAIIESLPAHRVEEGKGESVRLVFDKLEDLEVAKEKLSRANCRFRSGLTLVPFRLTGNLDWSLPAPEIDGLTGLTFWVWPESLWAPISFTAARLEELGRPREEWKRWWCSKDAQVYQIIGEDNLFFYGIAEFAMFLGMQGESMSTDVPDGQLQLPHIIANRHVLFLDKKASSSGKIKPPMAKDLLAFYTADQLRIHFLSLGLGMRNVSFRPKPLDPNSKEGAGDPVLKDGNILSNAFNKAIRSSFYTAQKFYDRKIPEGNVTQQVLRQSEIVVLDYELAMAGFQFHAAINIAATYIRDINKRWDQDKPFAESCDPELRRQTLIDVFYMVRIALVLMHPIAPVGTEKVRRQLNVGDEFWSWERIFDPITSFLHRPDEHQFDELPPRTDFFEKPLCQVKDGAGRS
jgi:methionyl-tRNA synthetase